MISSQTFRLLHTSSLIYQTAPKLLLAKLRKKTGYTFVNCKKALELHSNDIEKAELWLRDQAQQHGWSQAARLQGRTTKQGLIAVVVEKNYGALIELNCETDFVARNKKFHALAETVLRAVLNYKVVSNNNELSIKSILHTNTLKNLNATDGKSLADHCALTIGEIGENISLRRALYMHVDPKVLLFGSTHPAPMNPMSISFGRYGALVALKCKEQDKGLGGQLCQHVIGMNPSKIGDISTDLPNLDIDDETCMIYQEFLLDQNHSVQQVLIGAQAKILDFARFEIGEEHENESLDTFKSSA